MDYRNLKDKNHPLHSAFSPMMEAKDKKEDYMIKYPDLEEILSYVETLEKTNKKLNKYKIKELRRKVVEENKIYRVSVVDNENHLINDDMLLNYNAVMNMLVYRFDNEKIKELEKDLLLNGYIIVNTGTDKISIQESVYVGE